MPVEHITLTDILIIFLYLIGMLVIGFVFVRKVRSKEDFYLAGRSLGTLTLLATVCASIIGGSAMLGKGGYAYNGGMLCVAVGLPYLIGMLFFSGYAGRISTIGRRYNLESIPDLMEYRFGKGARYISAAMICYSNAAVVGAQISACATLFSVLGGNFGITYVSGAVIATAIFCIYTASSGLFGVVYTDLVQFFVLIIFVYIMLPILTVGNAQVGGIAGLIAKTPPSKWRLELNTGTVTLIVTNLIVTMAGAEYWQRAMAAKNRKTATRGLFLGTGVYALTIIVTLFLGLAAAILLPNLLQEYGTADYAIPVMVARYLPSGLTGLTFAGMLSVMMSSADTSILMSTQSLVEDIFFDIRPAKDSKENLRVSRIVTIVLTALALVVALFYRSAYDALMFAWVFYTAAMGIPCFAALFWKKATAPGIISGMLTGFATSILWDILGTPWGISTTIAGVVLGAAALFIVSLATWKEHPSKFADSRP